MPPILNMPQQLLELGRTYLSNGRNIEGLRILRRLVRLPNVSPRISAEANYLIAQDSLRRSAYSEAKEALQEALERDPKNARCHYLFAQSHEAEQAEQDSVDKSLEHYATACALAPDDGRMASAFALRVSRVQDRQRGLVMLRECYQRHGDDPAVVEDFIEGLIEAGEYDRAELVVTQSLFRNDGDDRFRDIRRRLNNRLREERLFGGYRPADQDSQDILRFENFSSSPTQQSKSDKPAKPRGQKPPRKTPEVQEEPVTNKAEAVKVPVYGPQMNLAAVLKQSGTVFVSQLYDQLGLMGRSRADVQRKEIQTVLLQRSFLKSMIKRFSPSTRKLLRSVVQSGGFVPANILFQTTGPDAPPPDYCQPLLQSGLLYMGKDQGRPRSASSEMVAVVPTDLLEKLADVLGVDLDEE